MVSTATGSTSTSSLDVSCCKWLANGFLIPRDRVRISGRQPRNMNRQPRNMNMNIKSKRYPNDMDKDMIPLCDALNDLKGTRTFFCCSGHGRGYEGDFYISLGCSNMKSLKTIVESFNGKTFQSCGICKPYTIDLDTRFWPIQKNEISIRICNACIDHLKYHRRKREFERIIAALKM